MKIDFYFEMMGMETQWRWVMETILKSTNVSYQMCENNITVILVALLF